MPLLLFCLAASNTSQFTLLLYSLHSHLPSKNKRYQPVLSSAIPRYFSPLLTYPSQAFLVFMPNFRKHSSPSSGSKSSSCPRSCPRCTPYTAVHQVLPSIRKEKVYLLLRNRDKALVLPTEKIKIARLVKTWHALVLLIHRVQILVFLA